MKDAADRIRAGTDAGERALGRLPAVRPGFSLVELLLVMTVTLVLTGMMIPILAELRENAHRVVCSSNLRQIGLSIIMWYDHEGHLPESWYAEEGRNKHEMMAAHRGDEAKNWEGLGRLFNRRYCDSPEVFYCPSHMGDHPYEEYAQRYYRYRAETLHPGSGGGQFEAWIYTNYHYAGHVDWEQSSSTPRKPYRQLNGIKGPSLVIAADGLRTSRDFNHRTGLNVLKGDGSVNWREDSETRAVVTMLPSGFEDPDEPPPESFRAIWKILVGTE